MKIEKVLFVSDCLCALNSVVVIFLSDDIKDAIMWFVLLMWQLRCLAQGKVLKAEKKENEFLKDLLNLQ